MRRAAKVDTNQAGIVQALKSVGCSVQTLAAVGDGVPDLLVGRAGTNYLLEVKDGTRPPSEQRLTPAQQEFHSAWRGRVAVVNSVAGALWAVGLGVQASKLSEGK